MVSTKHGAVQNGKAGDCQEGEFCLWVSWIRAWQCIMLANAFSFLVLEITGICPQFLSFIALLNLPISQETHFKRPSVKVLFMAAKEPNAKKSRLQSRRHRATSASRRRAPILLTHPFLLEQHRGAGPGWGRAGRTHCKSSKTEMKT